jgi:hypothetical protein
MSLNGHRCIVVLCLQTILLCLQHSCTVSSGDLKSKAAGFFLLHMVCSLYRLVLQRYNRNEYRFGGPRTAALYIRYSLRLYLCSTSR